MKTAGIIAEFNPLHNGHEYMIRETRRLTGCESVCIAMSGNFVQRGEPAILDKWVRTELALKSGADLVMEIPTLHCLGHAAQYARSAVRLLESLGTDMTICCGSGSGDSIAVGEVAALINNNINEIEGRFIDLKRKGLSYPAAREKALTDILKSGGASDSYVNKVSRILNDPNDILALEYFMAASKSEVRCISREGAGYNDEFTSGAEFQSAGAIREVLSEQGISSLENLLSDYLPSHTRKALSYETLVYPDKFTELIRYAVMKSTAAQIDDCPSGGEGLGNLMKSAVMQHDNIKDIILAVKSKRYTYTRISRLCMQVILGISRNEYGFTEPGYIRVLGFTERGRALLSEIKRCDADDLPIITNINKESGNLSSEARKMLELDVNSADVYNLILGRNPDEFSDHRKSPVLF